MFLIISGIFLILLLNKCFLGLLTLGISLLAYAGFIRMNKNKEVSHRKL